MECIPGRFLWSLCILLWANYAIPTFINGIFRKNRQVFEGLETILLKMKANTFGEVLALIVTYGSKLATNRLLMASQASRTPS